MEKHFKKYALIVLFCAFCNSNSFCQIKSGTVIYGIKKNPSSVFKQDNTNLEFKKVKEKVDNIIQTFKFVLIFNENTSLFSLEKKMFLDNSEFHTGMALLATGGNSVFYTDKKMKIIFKQTDFLGELFLINTPFLEWELTKEQKKINNYICYKAITKKELLIPHRKKEYVTYYVWYCPELSFNFGPFEFSGLPGLVLEVSNEKTKTIYFAKEIKLSEEDVKIVALNKGKMVTKDEYDMISKKAIENIDH